MKKIIALACALVMLVSMFTVSANAAVDGVEAELEFVGFEKVSETVTFAVVNLNVTIPETLAPYEEVEPDWVTSEEYTYAGTAIQGLGFDIPYVDGLSFTKGKCTSTIGATITANAGAKKATVSMANTGGYDTYYSGEFSTIATLYYRVADTSATYNLALSDAVVKLYSWAGVTDAPTITEYTFADFATTGATVAPEKEEFVPETIKGDEIAASATEVVLPKSEGSLNTNTYTNVAVFNATLGADVNYSEAGFIFVKDGAEAKNPYAVDASVIAGGGTFEYGVVMVAIPDGVTISAIPYYVTAE